MIKIQPVILAGGQGTRLWPLSRAQYPKQLLQLFNDKSMLQNTLLRFKTDHQFLDPILIINAEHRFLITEQVEEIGVTPRMMILEPFGRNTAPAALISALLTEKEDNIVLAILPADHYIGEISRYHETLTHAAECAQQDRLVMLGIPPESPHTGYGYIKAIKSTTANALKVAQFIEKPSLTEAKKYINSGDYFWNSGIYVFKSSCFINEVKAHDPVLLKASQAVVKQAQYEQNSMLLPGQEFEKCANISIDYAVMEYTQNGVMIPANFSWSDVGNWKKLWELCDKDESNNIVIGDVLTKDVKNSYIRSEKRLVAAQGIENTVIIETADALYVGSKDSVEEIKLLTANLKKNARSEFTHNLRHYRPWGFYESLDMGSNFQVKRLTVKPNAKLSLQLHYHRAEHWVVVSGTARITCGDEVRFLSPNESTYIPKCTVHRIENPGKIPLVIIEVQSGCYLGEDDIVRLEDSYNRESIEQNA